MREYFEEQIEKSEPLTEEMIEELKQGRIERGVSTASLEGLQVGDKFLYYLDEQEGPTEDGSNINLEVKKIVERELDEFAENYTFQRIAGGALPVFKKNDS